MPILAVECGKCGARLKIKSGLARTPVEIRCPKCGKMIPVSKSAAAPTGAPVAPVGAPSPLPVEDDAVPVATPADECGDRAEPEEAVPVAAPAPLPVTPPVVEPAPEPEALELPPPLPVMPAAPMATAPVAAPSPAPAAAPATASIPLGVAVSAAAPAPAAPSVTVRKAAAPIVLSHLGEQHGALNLTVRCPACNWQTKVREELIGKKIRCKQCNGIVPVTADEEGLPSAVVAPSPAPEPAPVPMAVAVEIPVAPVVARRESGRVPLDHDEPVLRVGTRAPTAPVLIPVPAPGPSPKQSSITSSTVDALVAEVAQLKTRLLQIDGQKNDAIRRADAAEKAFQEQAGHKAIDEMNARRRLADLETQVQAQRALLAELKAEAQAELQAATQRVAALQNRVSRMG